MATVETSSQVIPPLVHGDRLTRDEFERRYDAMPHLKKAELIEGEVHMPSPVRLEHHGGPHADFIGWLVFYRAHTPGIRVGDNVSIRLDMSNEPQPDSAMIVEPAFGGNVQLSPDDYVLGGPELVGEIAGSSAKFDLNTKFHIYRRNQVQEYIVWRVPDEGIDWFVFGKTQYDSFAAGRGRSAQKHSISRVVARSGRADPARYGPRFPGLAGRSCQPRARAVRGELAASL
jgi:hypothetical protein